MNTFNLLVIAITYSEAEMAQNLHLSLCLDKIQQKDTYLTFKIQKGIMEQMKENSFGGTLQMIETPY